MDTLTKKSQGMTKPLGMTGTVPGIENLPTNFGGAKPMDAMRMMGMRSGLDSAMNPNTMALLGPQTSSYLQGKTGSDPMSSNQDLVDYVAGKGPGGADDAVAKKAMLAKGVKAREEMLDLLNKNMKFQDLDLTSSIRRRR